MGPVGCRSWSAGTILLQRIGYHCSKSAKFNEGMDDAALERHFLKGLLHPRRQIKMCAEAEVEISRLHDATQKFHIVAEAQPPIHETSKMKKMVVPMHWRMQIRGETVLKWEFLARSLASPTIYLSKHTLKVFYRWRLYAILLWEKTCEENLTETILWGRMVGTLREPVHNQDFI